MTTVEELHEQTMARVQARATKMETRWRTAAGIALILLGTLFGLAIGEYRGEQNASTAEVEYADAVTAEYPELDRIDALMYGWMVCEAYGDGWTEQQTAAWLNGAPADFYGVTDLRFGWFVVDAAEPMCSR